MKTGHTESAGYSLIASAQRSGRRLVSVVIGVGFGIAPALGGSNRGSMAILIGRRSGGMPAAVTGRRWLLVSQVALSLVLLAGAGLMLATAARLLAEPLGFDPSGLLTFSVEAPKAPAYVTDLGLRDVTDTLLRGKARDQHRQEQKGWDDPFHRDLRAGRAQLRKINFSGTPASSGTMISARS